MRQPLLSKRSFRFPVLIERIQLPLPECISCQPVTSLLQLYTHMHALCHLKRMQMLSKEMHIQQCSSWVNIKCYINVALEVLTNVKRLRIALSEKSDYIQYEQFHSGQISLSWDKYQSKPGNSSCWHVVRKISPFYNSNCLEAELLLCRAFIVQVKWKNVKGIIIHAEKR